mgnify:CR=1 FL=1
MRSNSRADAIAQALEPGARRVLALGEGGVVGQLVGVFSRRAHQNPAVWRRASLNTIAAGQRDIERARALLQRNAQPEVGRVVHLCRARRRFRGRAAAMSSAPEGDVGKALAPLTWSAESAGPGVRDRA